MINLVSPQGEVASNSKDIDNYEKPFWGTFCRVLGVISLLCFIIAASVGIFDVPIIARFTFVQTTVAATQ